MVYFIKNLLLFIFAWGVKPHAIKHVLSYYCVIFFASKFTKYL